MTDKTDSKEREVAEQWLRDRYGAYRGHFAWRELEEAFLAGRASLTVSAVSGPLMGKPQAMPDLSALTERGAKAWAGVDAQGLREGRWYMVTHDGVATLCEDRRDAEEEAKAADMAWPYSGPHRAVQLVEASMAGYTAADMATAAAQGFRDGVASASVNSDGSITPGTWAQLKLMMEESAWGGEIQLSDALANVDEFALASIAASAGSEPVAWQYRSLPDVGGVWFECSKERADQRAAHPERWEVRPLYTHPSPPEGMVGGWTKASQQLPPCRDDQLYIGVNTAGFVGVFNAVTDIAGDVHCHYETAEECIDVMSNLDIWQPFTPPTSSADSGKGE